jgi:hypothetical protein
MRPTMQEPRPACGPSILNGRFGGDRVGFGGTGKPRVWTLRSDMLSPRYTTEWAELLRV